MVMIEDKLIPQLTAVAKYAGHLRHTGPAERIGEQVVHADARVVQHRRRKRRPAEEVGDVLDDGAAAHHVRRQAHRRGRRPFFDTDRHQAIEENREQRPRREGLFVNLTADARR